MAAPRPPARRRGSGAAVLLALLLVALLAAGAWLLLGGFPRGNPLASLTHPDGANPEACSGTPLPEGDIQRQYGWNYGGKPWCFSVGFPQAFRDEYAQRSHTETEHRGAYGKFVRDAADDAYVRDLVQKFRAAASGEGWGRDETVSFMATFVQSLPYTSDTVTTGFDDYIRYPLQTLMDDGGDCEDTSILLAALLQEMGYGVVLLSPPGHLAVGVLVAQEAAGGTATVPYQGRHYAYTETTGDGWRIGQVPPEHAGSAMTIYEV